MRRLEGTELFPEQDERGVHWFDAREVERVAERLRDGLVRSGRGEYLRSPSARRRRQKGPLAKLRRENERLREQNALLEKRLRELEASVGVEVAGSR